MFRLVLALAFVAGTIGARASEPPIPPTELAAMRADFNARLESLDVAIKEMPDNVALYSRRGDAHLFLGHFAAAISDFEKMIALDPAQDAPHWRLGIAYYFAGRFVQSSAQFAKYHGYVGRDHENGLWKFLGDVKTLGLEPARRAMLAYTQFDREPFPSLYELFAGVKTTAEFFADLKVRHLDDNPRVMFFANYYAGLNDEILGRHELAISRLHAAVANPWGRTAENGPAYMWQVARLHYEQLSAAANSPKPQEGRQPR